MKLTAKEKEICHEIFTNLNDTDISRLKKLNKEHLIKIIIEGNLAYKVEKDAADHFSNKLKLSEQQCKSFQKIANKHRERSGVLYEKVQRYRAEFSHAQDHIFECEAVDAYNDSLNQNTMGESNEAVRH